MMSNSAVSMSFDSENRTRPYAEILIVRLHKHIM